MGFAHLVRKKAFTAADFQYALAGEILQYCLNTLTVEIGRSFNIYAKNVRVYLPVFFCRHFVASVFKIPEDPVFITEQQPERKVHKNHGITYNWG